MNSTTFDIIRPKFLDKFSPGIHAGFSTEIEGDVIEAIKPMFPEDVQFFKVYQRHTSKVILLDSSRLKDESYRDEIRSEEADGLITCGSKTAVGIVTADCLPLILCAPEKKIVGAIHCGWRGVARGIVTNTICGFQALGATSQELYAVLGPAVCRECYEVGKDVYEAFSQFGLNEVLFKPQKDKYLFDLSEAVRRLLIREGVTADHIANTGLCTLHDEAKRFASYRRQKENAKRQISFIYFK